MTLIGLGLNFLAGWILSGGYLFLGSLAVILASLSDMLDGPLARITKQESKFGAFLDSTVDRYSDFFIFGGLAVHFARSDQPLMFLLTLGTLAGAFVTSYAKARAENFIKHCHVGFFERPERIIAVALGTLIPLLLPLTVWVLFIGTNATAVQRILYTQNALNKQSSNSANEPASESQES
jgi:CDP-diacylglycerol--glycerol-3-phosphate 3-phosphatidyltransferase